MTGGDPEPDRALERATMVERQLRRRGIHDARVLEAFATVPREAFVEAADRASAYEDRPLSIGAGQTISQPYVVAVMIEALKLTPDDRVLEVGAGSGYAAALLSRLAASVVALERHPALAAAAGQRLRRLGYDNVEVRVADGLLGLPDGGEFQAIMVSAAGRDVPLPLLHQLVVGGRLVMPVGSPREQRLWLVTKLSAEAAERRDLGLVSFVPLLEDIEPGAT